MSKTKYLYRCLLLACCAGVAAPLMSALTTQPLSKEHTLVRVPSQQCRYVLLGIDDDGPEAQVRVLADGVLAGTLSVRLATDKPDYRVPFDLSPYKGKSLALDVRHDAGARPGEDIFILSDTFDTANREAWRPAYHHTPQWGWMNDPNGMYYRDGLYHLNYQLNPYGSRWQNLSWGHATSPDLVHWQQHSPTLRPDGLGMIFSGSAVLDSLNTSGFGSDAVVAVYTQADATQQQGIAYSNDGGYTFTPYAGNPVLTLPTEARDPKVFWHAPSGQWVMTLAHALDHEILIFTSPDLKTWTQESAFGKGLGAQDGVWECPDLIEMAVPGTDATKWVMIVNINPGGPFGGSATQYFVGDFDGRTFTPDTDADGRVPTLWLDHGKDHYAAVTYSNAPAGRHILQGWMSNWEYAADVPTLQYRSANTLPRDMALFRGADNLLRASVTPSPELLALRQAPVVKKASFTSRAKARRYALPADGLCEVTATLVPGRDAVTTLTFANGLGQHTVVAVDAANRTVSVDRRASGVVDFAPSFPAVTSAPIPYDDDAVPLRIFLDRSSIEVFDAQGRLALTTVVFPNAPYTSLDVATKGSTRVDDLTIYPLK